MSISLLVAPAAFGKTAFVVDLVREASRDLLVSPRVIVATGLQRRAFHRRLAEAGGAIGVRVQTFDQLFADILNVAGETCTELSDPVQFRLIRTIVDELPLVHYAPIKTRPGFIQVLQRLIGELKGARVFPESFTRAVGAMGGEPRLVELAQLYATYQARLRAEGWADRAGMGWLAVETLEVHTPSLVPDWPLVVVDGFASFTPTQVALLETLGKRINALPAGRLIVTLTGDVGGGAENGGDRSLAHRRFLKAREALELALGVQATALPKPCNRRAQPLAHLERNLFRRGVAQRPAESAVSLVAAPDRAAEVRAALRWLKARIVHDGLQPAEVALLMRDVTAYRPFISQTAREYGLSVRLVDGLPLVANPAIAAVLNLLRLILPTSDTDPEPTLAWRPLVDAWRSPYFDWSALPEDGALDQIGILPQDADDLGTVARWGRVLGGLSQWEETLAALAGIPAGASGDEESDVPPQLPTGAAACELRSKFDRFTRRLTPPDGARSYREYAGWLEDLIGPDPDSASSRFPAPSQPTSLQVVTRTRQGSVEVEERDVAALQVLKDILRGLVWAEEALRTVPVSFRRFVDELVGAVEAAQYALPVHPELEEVLVASVVQARGVPFRAVALLGMAEGEFPATISEDPFLRDEDRTWLRDNFGMALDLSTESEEAGFFYEAVTRPRERLLLTRPRLADAGSLWQPSPFWEEVCRLVDATPVPQTSDSIPPVHDAASWTELMQSLSVLQEPFALREWIGHRDSNRLRSFDEAVEVVHVRSSNDARSRYDGALEALSSVLRARLGPERTWSASRLENYRTCPFLFFVTNMLGLEPRQDPSEGLEPSQLGNVFHRIFEILYQSVADPTDLGRLLDALPAIAEPILDNAPAEQGFRQTAWWEHTKAEILAAVAASLEALSSMQGAYVPTLFEARFGLCGNPPLIVREGTDLFAVRGLIDRVDVTPDGCVRIIDYKTGGPSAYTHRAVAEGKKLQLPLYALAARDALSLGKLADGFYWHIRQAERSSFTLARFEGGPGAAIAAAVEHAWSAVRASREGHFAPHPPDDGCPPWCPAATFCWHTRVQWGG